MTKPTMSHAVSEAHLNVLLVKYYENLEAQQQKTINKLASSLLNFTKLIDMDMGNAIDWLEDNTGDARSLLKELE